MGLGSKGPNLDEINASDVIVTPTGNVSSTDLQSAITEIDTEKAKLTGGNSFTGNQTITSGNVGIGTISPDDPLTISKTDSTTLATIINTNSTSARYPGLTVVNYMGSVNAGYPTHNFVNYRGPNSAPTAVQNTDVLFALQGYGANGVGANNNLGAKIYANASEAYSGTAGGGRLIFSTTKNGTTNPVDRMLIDNTGAVGIGTNSPDRKLVIDGTAQSGVERAEIKFDQTTIGASAPGPGITFWSASGTGGSKAAVLSSSWLGQFAFYGAVNSTPQYATGAMVNCRVDGTVTANAVPGQLEFRTSSAAGTNDINFVIRSGGALEATQAVNYTTLVTQSYHLANKGYVDSVASAIKYKTSADVANSSNTTLTNITALQHSVVAGTTYVFEYYLLYTSAATTTGIALSMGATTAVGTISARGEATIAADGTAAHFEGAITSFGDVVISTATPALATVYVAKISGVFVCTTSGTLYPQFRSEINGSAITLKAGSAAVLVSI